MPIEHLEANQSVLFFLLNERIDLKDKFATQKIDVYFRLFLNDQFLKNFTMSKLHNWLLYLTDLSADQHVLDQKDDIFEKLIKKALMLLLRERSFQNIYTLSRQVIFHNFPKLSFKLKITKDV